MAPSRSASKRCAASRRRAIDRLRHGVLTSPGIGMEAEMAEAQALAGKVAIITGSGKNIGKAIALRLAADGAAIVVNGRGDRAIVEETAGEIRAAGGRAMPYLADISKSDAVHGAPAGGRAGRGRSREIPAGRQGQPEEIAAMVRFLVGPEGRYVAGQTIHVNGGLFLAK